MQASKSWSPPTGTLGAIVAEARLRADELRAQTAELERHVAFLPPVPRLSTALGGRAVAVIAEVKRRSPSKGTINGALSAQDRARAYEGGGAAAISVLTEPRHFGGSTADLTAVRGAVSIPVLKKDFHVDPVQVLEARSVGASALLLIARALEPRRLAELARLARDAGIEAVVEVRDERELEHALESGAEIVGVNNRNLETLVIDQMTSERLIPFIPADVAAIAESGFVDPEDVGRVAAAGADAILVGSSLSAAADPVSAVRRLTGIAKVPRGR